MTNIQTDFSLKKYNTFGIDVCARRFVVVQQELDLQELIQAVAEDEFFILGGGSNILLTKNIEDVLVVKNEIAGKQIVAETEQEAVVAIGAGENWHETVLWALRQHLGGIENLSLIPGTAGAAPIQNIGAYGVELQDVFERLEAVHLRTGAVHTFDAEDCQFGYRMSVFKKKYKGLFCITKVYLRLSKAGFHRINTSYGALRQYLDAKNIASPSIKEVSNAVIAIRSSKLPDPQQLGNSGSFFKNPVIPKTQLRTLQKQFPNIVFYPVNDEKVKVPAGWLIEQCGWKGKRIGEVGCYKKQALVLVNYGTATGKELHTHAQRVIASVNDTFGIRLVPEVTIL